MNTAESNPGTEPRWASYTKAAIFMAPALFLWSFSVVSLHPKLQHMCQQVGMALPSIFRVTSFSTGHYLLIGGTLALLLTVLERRWSQWPRYRRLTLGSMAFLVNGAVLALITTMVIYALVAAPHLGHHAP